LVAVPRSRTRRRFERRASKLVRRRGGTGRWVKRPFPTTDLGRGVLSQALPALAVYMASDDAPPPCEWLEPFIPWLRTGEQALCEDATKLTGRPDIGVQLTAGETALVALASLMEQIDKGRDWDEEGSARRRGWRRGSGPARMRICRDMGRQLRDKLELKGLECRSPETYDSVTRSYYKHLEFLKHRRLKWTDPQCVEAGDWLQDCALRFSDLFELDEDRFPKYADHHKQAIDRLREELIERDPIYLPLLEPPQPWTDWDVGGGPVPATFVRDGHPDTEKAIHEAFARSREAGWRFEHAEGVNRAQAVAWRINEAMLPVVRRFAGVARDGGQWGGVGKQVSKEQVWRDLATARYLVRNGPTFWVDMNIDTRGRLYGIPHFNFLREDHVRSLFLFDQGIELGGSADARFWLLIHLANCFDADDGDAKIGKRVWDRRADWSRNHQDMIERTAHNPEDTVDWWRKADAPFSFVAACTEWVAASAGKGYITRLPITFDATCNGLQHLAALSRDEVTGCLTNLIAPSSAAQPSPPAVEGLRLRALSPLLARPSLPLAKTEAPLLSSVHSAARPQAKKPQKNRAFIQVGSRPAHTVLQDAYRLVLKRVEERVEAERTHVVKGKEVERPSALFWLAESRLNRKLIKRPAGTFGYSVTAQGMRDQIVEEYKKQHDFNEPRESAAWYLAHRIMDACREGFKKPAEVMDFIRALAGHLADHNLPIRWTSPTGLPVANHYYPPRGVVVDNQLHGHRVRFLVANGWEPTVDKDKAMNAAAPNFVHSLDASHVVRVINACANEGITNVATIHDCVACLAPQAGRVRGIWGRQLALLHAPDLLTELRSSAQRDHDRAAPACELSLAPVPPPGSLDPSEIERAEFLIS
jgi:DNA-dependent RNA polymerase